MARKDANRGKAEQAVERHIRAFELRKTGATYREIAAQLGVSVATVYEDCQRVLDELRGQALANASDYVALELERLDMAQFALFQHLETGDPSIINAWVKVSESRRKLLGLDAPAKIAQTNPDGTPAAYAELRTVVLNLLAPYPELRQMIAAQLAEDATEN